MKQQLHTELDAAVEYFNRSTAALTEADASFTPTDGTFTTAQQVAHAAQTIDWFIEGAFRPDGFDMDFEAHDRKVRDVTTLSEARAWFVSRSRAPSRRLMPSLTTSGATHCRPAR